MGRYDFEFGYNEPDAEPPKGDVPTYASINNTGPCTGSVTCTRCGRRHGLCNEVNEQLTGIKDDASIYSNPGQPSEEWNKMIPRGNSEQSSGGGNRSFGNGKRKQNGYTYLSTADLSTEKQTAKILDAKTMPDDFKPGQSKVVIKLKFKGEIKLWSLRQGNPNLETLGDALGDDETQWTNASVELFNEQDSFSGKMFMHSEVETPEAARPKKTKRG